MGSTYLRVTASFANHFHKNESCQLPLVGHSIGLCAREGAQRARSGAVEYSWRQDKYVQRFAPFFGLLFSQIVADLFIQDCVDGPKWGV